MVKDKNKSLPNIISDFYGGREEGLYTVGHGVPEMEILIPYAAGSD
jgi:hypothetical protein